MPVCNISVCYSKKITGIAPNEYRCIFPTHRWSAQATTDGTDPAPDPHSYPSSIVSIHNPNRYDNNHKDRLSSVFRLVLSYIPYTVIIRPSYSSRRCQILSSQLTPCPDWRRWNGPRSHHRSSPYTIPSVPGLSRWSYSDRHVWFSVPAQCDVRGRRNPGIRILTEELPEIRQ